LFTNPFAKASLSRYTKLDTIKSNLDLVKLITLTTTKIAKDTESVSGLATATAAFSAQALEIIQNSNPVITTFEITSSGLMFIPKIVWNIATLPATALGYTPHLYAGLAVTDAVSGITESLITGNTTNTEWAFNKALDITTTANKAILSYAGFSGKEGTKANKDFVISQAHKNIKVLTSDSKAFDTAVLHGMKLTYDDNTNAVSELLKSSHKPFIDGSAAYISAFMKQSMEIAHSYFSSIETVAENTSQNHDNADKITADTNSKVVEQDFV
jgi:hypothetical protein